MLIPFSLISQEPPIIEKVEKIESPYRLLRGYKKVVENKLEYTLLVGLDKRIMIKNSVEHEYGQQVTHKTTRHIMGYFTEKQVWKIIY